MREKEIWMEEEDLIKEVLRNEEVVMFSGRSYLR